MAQSGYTPILIYASGTTGNTPLAANLTSTSTGAELALNYFDGKLFYKDASGNVQVLASKAGNINVSSLSFGTTGLTPNTATTGAITVAGTLITSNGGTGLTTYTAGDLPYYASGTALSKLGIGTSGYILSSSGTAPQWVNSISIGSATFTSVTDSGLTAGRVTYSGTVGLLQDSANMTFDGTSLNLANDASISGLTVGKGAGAVSGSTVVGYQAGTSNVTGAITAFGYQALYSNNTSSGLNLGVGYQAGYSISTGTDNVAVGSYHALYSTTTGSANVAIGREALQANTTASNNTAVGYLAGYSNTIGTANSVLGGLALYNNTTGSYNVAIGSGQAGLNYGALGLNTTGSFNTAIGYGALIQNTTASNNTAVGYQAGYSNTTGAQNTNLGTFSGYTNTVASGNVFLGYNAGYTSNASSDGYNTAVGASAGYSLTTGVRNSFFGTNAGYYVTTGAKNTVLGAYTGNQGGLDIRTASNYIVLSDGDGNPRLSIPTGTATATVPNATGTVMVSGNMPAFSAFVANAYTLPYNVTTKVPFDTKVFDTNTNFSTSNNRFTPTVAGYYLINSFIGVSGSGGTQTGSLGLVMNLYKNGSNFAQLGVVPAAASYPFLNCSQLVYANGTTDYFEIWIYSNANVAGVSIQNGQTFTSFSAALIRSA